MRAWTRRTEAPERAPLTPDASTASAARSAGRTASNAALMADDNEEEEGDDLENADRVYRPLLFQSKGYASSDLFRDDFEMRSRMSHSTRLLDADHSAERGHDQREPTQPKIRLETLSSRAAATVLWITYLSFALALAVPYLQSQGYLETVIKLPGGVCDPHHQPDEPCIYVDKAKNAARWSAYVNNVSWLAGSVQIRLNVDHLRNTSSGMGSALFANGLGDASNTTAMALDVLDESFAFHYDLYLYGLDLEIAPASKDWITTEYNQTVWVTCPSAVACNPAKLLDLSRDFDGMGGNGYESYLLIIVFKGLYPNVIGHNITYDFAYTKPAIHISELIIRSGFLLATVLALPCWLIAVLNFHESWRSVLPVQKWVLALGVVLILWQNPIYATIEWYRSISLRTRFVSDTCESFAQSFFYVFWLKLMDHEGNTKSLLRKVLFGLVLFGVDTSMTVLRMPKLFFEVVPPVQVQNEFYTLLGFIRIALLFAWLVWIARIGWRTSVHLRTLPYMSSRFQQLSYRFLFIETLLIFVYISIFSAIQVFFLLNTWYELGYDAFLQHSVHEFSKAHAGRSSLGKFIFLSVYVYLVMFVHLPPSTGEGIGLLATTAYHIQDRPRLDKYGFLTPDSHLFCVETAKLMLDLAWQAYFDPAGNPSPSGYGKLKLEEFGYELVTQVRGASTDTHAIVAVSAAHNRLVVAFRGTTSKLNWKSNLKFHQKVLWITSTGKKRGRSCMERVKNFAAKIPVLNMALPRVHSGFWAAYASVRSELKEVIRLVLDENPGVSVYVTGHSMGGSLAILAAYDLAVNLSMKVNMYNFGGPRVGNPSFVRLYDKCVPTSYRIVMDGDIVPGVPDFWGLYQHAGTEISIDLEGNLIVDPSFVEKKLHVSSKRQVATHPTHVYRSSMAKCLDNLLNVEE
ncbi:hypothetical protein Poli38472_009079 [Pythium oligandrum]|uniref:Fungal lipase-like domain-containing protein n=1 Tax=Pythium oligandrum TaxID=41045 RepID=A0A8K1CK27_PYTOL|nr:hypothetical protein Poli38472_009079 [Pythium oligandrum]|eukprot:TMW64912.1 hypothetical protein Poli38472_009079 [Pythium oligandrum]